MYFYFLFVWKLVFNYVVCVYIEFVCVLDYNNIVFVYLLYKLVCVVIVINLCVSGGFVISVFVCMFVCDLLIVYFVLQIGIVFCFLEVGFGFDEVDV